MAIRATKAARLGNGKQPKYGFYLSYKFLDHDPILDQIDRLHELSAKDTGTGKPYTLQTISNRSGVTKGTLHNWKKRKTKKPQFATVKAVVKAMGGDLTIVYNDRRIITGSGLRLVK